DRLGGLGAHLEPMLEALGVKTNHHRRRIRIIRPHDFDELAIARGPRVGGHHVVVGLFFLARTRQTKNDSHSSLSRLFGRGWLLNAGARDCQVTPRSCVTVGELPTGRRDVSAAVSSNESSNLPSRQNGSEGLRSRFPRGLKSDPRVLVI